MVMDGDQVNFFFFFLPLPGVSICCIARPHNSTVCRLWGKEQNGGEGRGGALSPVCPEDPHVYDGMTQAVSPKPSSQMPGSYCFSPFGCPARGENTDRYLHWGHSTSFNPCVPQVGDFIYCSKLSKSSLHKINVFSNYY